MSQGTKLIGAVLVAVFVGFGVGYFAGPGPSASEGLNWEPSENGECTVIWVEGSATFSIVPEPPSQQPAYQLKAKDGRVEQCGAFKVYKISPAQNCVGGGVCDQYEDYPLPWPPSQ